MIPKNSDAAIAALHRAAAHYAKAIAEVHQARQELREVRHLPGPYLEGLARIVAALNHERDSVNNVAKGPFGFSMRAETPEEGP